MKRTHDPEESQSPKSGITTFLQNLAPWQQMLALIIFLTGGIYGAAAWIHNSARNAVLDEKFLATLAARVRPSCMFNSKGSIEADFGASDYIDAIEIKARPELFGYEVSIKGKRHLAYAPLVAGVDVALVSESATRGKMYDWNIILTPNSTFQAIGAEGGLDTNATHHFRLEIIH